MAWGRMVLGDNGYTLRLMGILVVLFGGTTTLVSVTGIDLGVVIDAVTLIWAKGR